MSFNTQQIEAVWQKGKIIPDFDAGTWRRDVCGTPLKKSEYGNRQSKYGWEIDQINPNGGDQLSNLQTLQWENNVAKSNGTLVC